MYFKRHDVEKNKKKKNRHHQPNSDKQRKKCQAKAILHGNRKNPEHGNKVAFSRFTAVVLQSIRIQTQIDSKFIYKCAKAKAH